MWFPSKTNYNNLRCIMLKVKKEENLQEQILEKETKPKKITTTIDKKEIF